MSILDEIKEETKKDHGYVVELRRYFHSHPELSRQEFNTANKIEEELDKLGISHKRVDETGVYAEIIGHHPGKTILLRADIDALPIHEKNDVSYKSQNEGVMHACGHDAHAASLLGACRILVNHKDDIYGKIVINFQQAEEIGYGARQFIDRGLVKNVDRTFGMHVSSAIETGYISLTPGPNNASVDWFKIKVKGKAAHVSTPDAGVDALYIASQIVCNIQGIVARLSSPMDNVLVGIGRLEAGQAYNIVAPSAEMEGTVRCLTPEVRKKTKEAIERIATNVAASYGGEVSFEWKDFTSPLINDKESCLEAAQVADVVVGADHIITDRKPALGGDDMAEYIIVSPGCYGFVGSHKKRDSKTGVAHHNEYFDIDEDCLLVSVAMYAGYAIDYLNKNK